MEVKTNLAFIFLYRGFYLYYLYCLYCGPRACLLFKVVFVKMKRRIISVCRDRKHINMTKLTPHGFNLVSFKISKPSQGLIQFLTGDLLCKKHHLQQLV